MLVLSTHRTKIPTVKIRTSKWVQQVQQVLLKAEVPHQHLEPESQVVAARRASEESNMETGIIQKRQRGIGWSTQDCTKRILVPSWLQRLVKTSGIIELYRNYC